MKFRINLLMALLFLSGPGISQSIKPLQIGDRFPNITGELLTKEKVEFPEHCAGKVSLVLVAFKRGTQQQINTWTNSLLQNKDPHPQFRWFEIPMISGFYNWMSNWIDNGMRSGIPENQHKNVLTYYGALDNYYKYFNVTDKNTCYLFLLDKKGNIHFMASGPATHYELTRLHTTITSLLTIS